MGKVVRKAFRILELDERKGRWVVEQDFHGNFQVDVTFFCVFFSGVLDWIVLILLWFERSLHSAQVSGQSCPWPLKLMMSQAVEGKWICAGGYRWLKGKWVKQRCFWAMQIKLKWGVFFLNTCICMLCSMLAELLACAKRARSGAPWVRKFGKLSIRENLVMT